MLECNDQCGCYEVEVRKIGASDGAILLIPAIISKTNCLEVESALTASALSNESIGHIAVHHILEALIDSKIENHRLRRELAMAHFRQRPEDDNHA